MLTLTELLKTTNEDLAKMYFKGRGLNFQPHLKSLVLEASLEQLEELINTFNEDEAFMFLEDMICAGKVPVMSEDDYWEFIGE